MGRLTGQSSSSLAGGSHCRTLLQCDLQDCSGLAVSAPAVQISMASIVTLNSGLSEWRELKLEGIDIFEATQQVNAAKPSAARWALHLRIPCLPKVVQVASGPRFSSDCSHIMMMQHSSQHRQQSYTQ